MTTLAEFRAARRFERTKAAVAFLIGAVGLALLLGPPMVRLLRGKNVLELASLYGPIVNIVFAALLVVITGLYACITYFMALQHSEARKSAIRPLLWIHAGSIEITSPEDPDNRRIATQFQVWNFGSGPALATHFDSTAVYEHDGKNDSITSTLTPGPPAVLAPGTCHECSWWTLGLPTDTSRSRERFLDVHLSWQDVEGNLYEMFTSFDLAVKGEWRAWMVNSEDLYFLQFRQRKSLGTGYREPGPPHRYKRLYGRTR